MVNPNPSPSWARKTAVVLFVLLLGLGVAIAFWVVSLRDRKWAALVARVEELAAKHQRPAPPRLSLGRTLLPGNAWDDYDAAFTWRPGQSPPIIAGKIHPLLHRRPEANRAEVESLLKKYSGCIDDVSQGARRLVAWPPHPIMFNSTDLTHLCLARARFMAEDGNLTGALDLLMDACSLAREVILSGQSGAGATGHQMFFSIFREIREVLQSREVSAEDLRLLETRLQELDDLHPGIGRDLENDLLELGMLLVREDREGRELYGTSQPERARHTWRSFYSSRLQAADTFVVADDLVRRILLARTLPWPEEIRALQLVYQEVVDFRDPLLAARLNHLYGAQTALQSRAALRLLRIAAHYRSTGEILELADPLGTTIRSIDSEGSLFAWHRSAVATRDVQPKKGSGTYWDTGMIDVSRR